MGKPAGWVQPMRPLRSRVGSAHPTISGASVAQVRAALAEVIPFHLDGLREGGGTVPLPESVAEWVEV